MSITAGHATLKEARKDLTASWHTVTTAWRDENRERFESEFLDPLMTRLRAAESAMAHMGMVLSRARRDCE